MLRPWYKYPDATFNSLNGIHGHQDEHREGRDDPLSTPSMGFFELRYAFRSDVKLSTPSMGFCSKVHINLYRSAFSFNSLNGILHNFLRDIYFNMYLSTPSMGFKNSLTSVPSIRFRLSTPSMGFLRKSTLRHKMYFFQLPQWDSVVEGEGGGQSPPLSTPSMGFAVIVGLIIRRWKSSFNSLNGILEKERILPHL